MTQRVENIIEQINIDNELSVLKALDQTKKLENLSKDEKNDLAAALSTIFYHHDHAGVTDMNKLAGRAEIQIANFGADVMPFLIEEMINADGESAAYLGKTIALTGCPGVAMILDAWNKNQEDDFAVINLIQALSYFKIPEVTNAMPQILVAAKSGNFQVRAMALYVTGKLALSLSANDFDEKLCLAMFDTAFELLSDRKPLVRKNAARTLGKMLKKGILTKNQEKKVFDAFQAILGKDGQHKWDRAFIVRHEAEHFDPYFKISGKPADRYRQSFRIVEKRELCLNSFYFVVEAPLIAEKIQAGQFIILRYNEFSERIPLSICGWDREAGTIHFIIMAVGKTTTEINHMNAGDCFSDIVGPLGQRSHVKKHAGTCIVIGGGYGTGAIIPTARDFKALDNKVIGIVGARSKELLIMIDELSAVCDEIVVTTNDGSEGKKGFVTNALGEIIKKKKVSHVLAVGPVPMMKAVSDMTRLFNIETYVSLNAIMVDGTGMCGACRVSVGGKTKFACFHGPDFNGHLVDFDQLIKRQKMFAKEEQKAMKVLAR